MQTECMMQEAGCRVQDAERREEGIWREDTPSSTPLTTHVTHPTFPHASQFNCSFAVRKPTFNARRKQLDSSSLDRSASMR